MRLTAGRTGGKARAQESSATLNVRPIGDAHKDQSRMSQSWRTTLSSELFTFKPPL